MLTSWAKQHELLRYRRDLFDYLSKILSGCRSSSVEWPLNCLSGSPSQFWSTSLYPNISSRSACIDVASMLSLTNFGEMLQICVINQEEFMHRICSKSTWQKTNNLCTKSKIVPNFFLCQTTSLRPPYYVECGSVLSGGMAGEDSDFEFIIAYRKFISLIEETLGVVRY